MMAVLCSKCHEPNDRRPQRYCRACHNAYQRAVRPKHSELSDEQRKKAVTRAYTRVLEKRGKLKREPCRDCETSVNVQRHHTDYANPRLVVWLCAPCHRHEHAMT